MSSFSGMDPELDPELLELMALEDEERARSAVVGPAGQDAEEDPELAELMALEEEERRRDR